MRRSAVAPRCRMDRPSALVQYSAPTRSPRLDAGPHWATNGQITADNTGHIRFGILPAHPAYSAIVCRSPPLPSALSHGGNHHGGSGRHDRRVRHPRGVPPRMPHPPGRKAESAATNGISGRLLGVGSPLPYCTQLLPLE